MSDDNPHSANGSSGKSWAAKLLQVFAGEPKSREELVDLIQDAEDRDLIDNDTREMIEGVLDVAELKVRDIMIPRSQMVTIDIHQGVDEFLPSLSILNTVVTLLSPTTKITLKVFC